MAASNCSWELWQPARKKLPAEIATNSEARRHKFRQPAAPLAALSNRHKPTLIFIVFWNLTVLFSATAAHLRQIYVKLC
jgi:hypothetical protein